MKRQKIYRNSINWDKIFFPGWINLALTIVDNKLSKESIYRVLRNRAVLDSNGQVFFRPIDIKCEIDVNDLIEQLFEAKTQRQVLQAKKTTNSNLKLKELTLN